MRPRQKSFKSEKLLVEPLEKRCLLAVDGPLMLGDLDWDRDVDFDDIRGFVMGLRDPAGYESLHDVPSIVSGDMDQDEDHDFDDIGKFRDRLTGSSIHGVKWLDVDGSGERDPFEPGLPGVVIYSDLNNNASLDNHEPLAVTMHDNPFTRFDEAGHYWMTGVRSGEHIVREILMPGFQQTFPEDGRPHKVELPPGQSAAGIDFGNQPISPGSIHGVKWVDRNGNAERDPDEPGLPGVTIYVDRNNNGRLDDDEPHTVTMRDNPFTDFDEAGQYWLIHVPSGRQVVREVVPNGFVQTFPSPDEGGAHELFLEPGHSVDGIDFGNMPIAPGSIHGIKWLDGNGNGEQEPDERGLAGVTIYSDLNHNGRLEDGEPHTVSMEDNPLTAVDESGHYWLENLRPGRHLIREVVPFGFMQTFPPPRPILLDDAFTIFPGDGAHHVFFEPGHEVTGIDFGNRPILPASVHGVKWFDANGNAERDPNERGIAGVVVYSDLNNNGVLDEREPRTRTMEDNPQTADDESGHYWLEDLRPRLHFIREVVPDGFMQTFPPHGPIPLPRPIETFTGPDGGIVHIEEEIVDVLPFPFPNGAHVIFLEPGDRVEGLDFGNRPILPGSVHGLKWLDANGNGERDLNEHGVPGVTVYSDLNHNGVLDNNEPRTETMEDGPLTSLNEAGRYWLELRPGFHLIREVVPDGFAQTFPPPGPILLPIEVSLDGSPDILPFPGGGAHPVFVEPGSVNDGLNFGNRPTEPGSVHGLKWLDRNGNAERDPDEPGLPGVTIYSDLNHNGRLDRGEPRTVTMEDDPDTAADEAGHYWLKLRPALHVIREVVPDGFEQTFPLLGPIPLDDVRPDILPPHGAHVVFVLPGQAIDGLDFGNRPLGPAHVHGTKWVDENGNGERESDEPGFPGVTIYSDLNHNGRLDDDEPHTETMRDDPDSAANESGHYWLELRAGMHVIREVVPDGFEQTFPPTGPIPHPVPFETYPGPDGGFVHIQEEIDVIDDFPIPFPGGGHVVFLGPGAEVDGLDFGNRPIQPAHVHGLKWLDSNGNGERENNEPGVPGVTIYSDLNHNGRFDEGEPHDVTMEADPNGAVNQAGHYWLELRPGRHVIREVVPDGFMQTFPPGPIADLSTNEDGFPDILPGNGAHVLFLVSGQVIDGIDFGNRPILPGSVHGIKWLDENGNGERETNERGVPSVTIYSDLNQNGRLDDNEPSTKTMKDDPDTPGNESGRYWLELRPGVHLIREVVPDGFMQTFPPPGPIPALADFPPGDGAHVVFVLPGEEIRGIDFGNRPLVPGSVHGLKWLDRNGNGEFDSDERGLPGVTIYSDLNRNGVFDEGEPHAVSMEEIPETDFDEGGLYWLELRPGLHVIREVVPDGFVQTFPPTLRFDDFDVNGILDEERPDILPNGAHVVFVEPGVAIEGIDFGNRPHLPASVHGTKWLDRNGNGERDDDEPGVPGVIIYSDRNRNGRFEEDEPHTKTMEDNPDTERNESGIYWLELRSGEHLIREVVPDGFMQTFPPSLHTDPADLSVGNGAHFVVLEPGDELKGIDFGNRPVKPGRVHGTKWLDANGNGERDPNEPGLPGVTIYSDLNHNGRLENDEPHTKSMEDNPVTDFDESGMYVLVLRPGFHFIREVVPDGFEQTFPRSPMPEPNEVPDMLPSDGAHVVFVEPGGGIDGIDFGNRPAEPASVHGIKWLDRNGNAERDPDEPGLPGVTIYSDLNHNGVLDDHEPHTRTMEDDPETESNESGVYWLKVRPGRHIIREVVPHGFMQTFPPVGPFEDAIDIFPGDGGHFVILEAGDQVDGIDFGNRPVVPGKVHGIKWLDENGNRERDTNEPGVPGMTIFSDVNMNGRFDEHEPHTETMRDDPDTEPNEMGHYWMELRPGFHYIREVVPDRFVQTFPPGPTPHRVDNISDILPGRGAHVVFVEPGGAIDGLDFGNRPIRPASVHGFKWLDANGNGERDHDEPGLAGVTIYSDLNHNGRFDDDEPHVVTMEEDPETDFDELGMYWLELRAGDHVIREVVPDGFVQTFPRPGSIFDPTFPGDGGHLVWLEPGQTVEGIDFGNLPRLPGSVHGVKWLDRNANAERDPDEPGVPGVVIYSDLNSNGILDDNEPHTRTMEDDPDSSRDESGEYWLEELKPGRHLIREVVPDGFEQTFPMSDLFLPAGIAETAGEEIPPDTEVHPSMINIELAAGEVFDTEVGLTFNPFCIVPFNVDVVASDPDVMFENLSGVQVNGCGGDTSHFKIILVGDGQPHSFELLFINAGFGNGENLTSADENGFANVFDTIPVKISVPRDEGGHLVFVEPGGATEGIDFGNRPICDDCHVMTEEVRVAASSDDAEETFSGSMQLTSPDLDVGEKPVGMRFTEVDIPNGSTIVIAYVQFEADKVNSSDTTFEIAGEAVADAPTFVDVDGNIRDRETTDASVEWTPEAWEMEGDTGPAQQTPDLSEIIQEIVNQSDWESGNALVLIAARDSDGDRAGVSYDEDPAGAPLLHIEFITDRNGNTGDPGTGTVGSASLTSDPFGDAIDDLVAALNDPSANASGRADTDGDGDVDFDDILGVTSAVWSDPQNWLGN